MSWGAAIGAGIGAISSALGQKNANQQNAALSSKQMNFQAHQSNTAHQREVTDLKAAGLNPMLSGMGGSGAPTSAGSMATAQNEAPDIGSVVSTALESRRLKKDLDLATSQILNQKAQTRKTDAEAEGVIYDNEKRKLKSKGYGAINKILEGGISTASELQKKRIKSSQTPREKYLLERKSRKTKSGQTKFKKDAQKLRKANPDRYQFQSKF